MCASHVHAHASFHAYIYQSQTAGHPDVLFASQWIVCVVRGMNYYGKENIQLLKVWLNSAARQKEKVRNYKVYSLVCFTSAAGFSVQPPFSLRLDYLRLKWEIQKKRLWTTYFGQRIWKPSPERIRTYKIILLLQNNMIIWYGATCCILCTYFVQVKVRKTGLENMDKFCVAIFVLSERFSICLFVVYDLFVCSTKSVVHYFFV